MKQVWKIARENGLYFETDGGGADGWCAHVAYSKADADRGQDYLGYGHTKGQAMQDALRNMGIIQ